MKNSYTKTSEIDELLILKDDTNESKLSVYKDKWKILIVDDDEEVHSVTKLVLMDFMFEGMGIKFLSAFSGEEAKTLILENPDAAIILLDVVMETDDSGIQLIKYIRDEIKNKNTRIILRTGQPGQVPERKVVTDYDINDYKEKSELTTQKLYTTIVSSLRSYRDLITIDYTRQGLEKIIESSGALFELQSVEKFFQGVLLQLITLMKSVKKNIQSAPSGFTAIKENDRDDFTVYTTIGDCNKYYKKKIMELSIPGLVENINRIRDENARSIHVNQYYINYFKSNNGSEIFLFIKEIMYLNEWDSYLFDVFCSNVAVAFENLDLYQERGKLENQIRQLQKMEAIGQLAGGVAHDFNNLLMVINVNCEFLLNDLPLNSSNYENVMEIKNAGERAGALTRQLLAFSRKQILQVHILDVNEIITNFEKMLKRLLPENIEFIVTTDTQLKKINADLTQIEQIILNLVVNARDAMPRGGILTIKTSNFIIDEEFIRQHIGAHPGSYSLITVMDTGEGMDIKTQKRIFEPFFTTKEAGKGTGLGLSTVYGIVKQSEGFIYVSSELGKGTAFHVYFPTVDNHNGEMKKDNVNSESYQGNETILLVEDESSVRLIISRMLENFGYTVIEAACGDEAIEISRNTQGMIHLLLTDVIMPGMNGFELSKNLQITNPQLKSLFISGYTNNAIVPQNIQEHNVGLIQKPVTSQLLMQNIRKLLDK